MTELKADEYARGVLNVGILKVSMYLKKASLLERKA